MCIFSDRLLLLNGIFVLWKEEEAPGIPPDQPEEGYFFLFLKMNNNPPSSACSEDNLSYEDLCAQIEQEVIQRLKDERKEKVAQQLEELKASLGDGHSMEMDADFNNGGLLELERWMKLAVHLQQCLEDTEADLGNQFSILGLLFDGG